jgi:hypothetical protein
VTPVTEGVAKFDCINAVTPRGQGSALLVRSVVGRHQRGSRRGGRNRQAGLESPAFCICRHGRPSLQSRTQAGREFDATDSEPGVDLA